MEPAAENNKGGGHFRKSEALLLLFSPGPYYLPSGIPSFISAGALSPSTVVLSPRPSHILTKLKISPSGHAENILRMGKIDTNGRRRRKITRRTPPPSTGRLIWTDGLKTLAGKNRATYLLSKGRGDLRVADEERRTTTRDRSREPLLQKGDGRQWRGYKGDGRRRRRRRKGRTPPHPSRGAAIVSHNEML